VALALVLVKYTFEEIDEARRVLGLGEAATLHEIIAAYRERAKARHPDAGGSNEAMKSLNAARRLLLDYCQDAPVSFRKEDVEDADEDEVLARRFYEGWLYDA
jgi:hypothetical protein